MNKRQIAFSDMLLKHREEFLPISFFARELETSPKTLYRDLAVMEEFLEGFQAKVEKRKGVGIRLCIGTESRESLRNHISYLGYHAHRREENSWQTEARRIDILLNLLLYSDEYTSLSSLAYKYYVSKSTVNQDLIFLEEILGHFSLMLRRTAKGTILSGDEREIRQAIVQVLSHILDGEATQPKTQEESWGRGQPAAQTLETILDIFKEDDICFANQLFNEMEEECKHTFEDREFLRLSLHFLVMAYRLKNGWSLKPSVDSGSPADENREEVSLVLSESLIIRKIAEKIRMKMQEHYHVELSVEEEKELERLLASTRISALDRGENSSRLFQLFCEDFIDAFAVITDIDLRENPIFCENVVAHINLMLNRLLHGAPASNPLLELLLKDYQSTLNVCRIICCILTEKFGLPELSIDEIGFLTLYILGETVRQSEHANVLFVTDLANSVANLTKTRLMQHFPQWKFDTCTPGKYSLTSRNAYDFCISTLMLEGGRERLPYVLVSPILEDRDFQNIQELFWKSSESAAMYFRELVRLINDLGDIGCRISFAEAAIQTKWEEEGRLLIRFPALKGIRYRYVINNREENCCRFILNKDRTSIAEVHINMCNLDFMLFSSKLVYLLDNCPDTIIPDFINYFMEGDRNV